jgi:5'-nucleotidase
VHLAITGILESAPDFVVAGINRGANLGDDVIYSGTVAAAMEGRFMGIPAIAVSLVGRNEGHYATAAAIVLRLIGQLRRDPLPQDTILNVNVPDRALAELRGIQATRLRFIGSDRRVRKRMPAREPIFRPFVKDSCRLRRCRLI